MRLDVSYNNVDAFNELAARRFEHGECFTHARRIAEEDSQLATTQVRFLRLNICEQGVRIRSIVIHLYRAYLARALFITFYATLCGRSRIYLRTRFERVA